MKEILISFLFGTSIGFGMLLCPQIRQFVNKTESKIKKKLQKLKEATNETSE